MAISRIFYMFGALALSGCEANVGANDAERQAEVKAEASAKEDMVTVKVPGIDIKVNIPEEARERTLVQGDDELIYPGSKVGGVHVEAGGKEQAGVEILFSSPVAPAKIADWYLDPARTGFKIDREAREGSAFVLEGHEIDDNSRFNVRLEPKGKGTGGVLSIRD